MSTSFLATRLFLLLVKLLQLLITPTSRRNPTNLRLLIANLDEVGVIPDTYGLRVLYYPNTKFQKSFGNNDHLW